MVSTSDVSRGVLLTLAVDGLVVSTGDDVNWDPVCAGAEPLGEGERVETVTFVREV